MNRQMQRSDGSTREPVIGALEPEPTRRPLLARKEQSVENQNMGLPSVHDLEQFIERQKLPSLSMVLRGLEHTPPLPQAQRSKPGPALPPLERGGVGGVYQEPSRVPQISPPARALELSLGPTKERLPPLKRGGVGGVYQEPSRVPQIPPPARALELSLGPTKERLPPDFTMPKNPPAHYNTEPMARPTHNDQVSFSSPREVRLAPPYDLSGMPYQPHPIYTHHPQSPGENLPETVPTEGPQKVPHRIVPRGSSNKSAKASGASSRGRISPLLDENYKLPACLFEVGLIPLVNEDGRHQCPLCPRHFKHFKHMRRHVVNHADNHPYSCESCPAVFRRRDTKGRHKHRFHEEVDPPYKPNRR